MDNSCKLQNYGEEIAHLCLGNVVEIDYLMFLWKTQNHHGFVFKYLHLICGNKCLESSASAYEVYILSVSAWKHYVISTV